jgi:hypothetical protein
MPSFPTIQTELSSLFFEPLVELYGSSEAQYRCTGITDLHFAQLGTLRCLSSAKTGQEFLQLHADHGLADIDPDHFFKALKSKRRLKNLGSLNQLLGSSMAERIGDPFAAIEELRDFELYAADGHYHHAASFDPKPEEKGKSAIATGHFFRLNLRTHHLSHLDTSRPADGKKKDHDMNVIKRSNACELRNHAEKGRKVLLAWDKACIDYRYWYKLKHNSGIYFITQEKANSAAEECSIRLFDPADPRNEGVVSDTMVATNCGVQLRRIVYIDPRDGNTYTYLTNEMTLPAGVLVLVYKQRWDIEKVFNELKSKMEERKSWGSGPESKSAHAQFECVAHNLVLLLETHLTENEGLRDEVEAKKKIARRKTRINRAGKLLSPDRNFINRAVQRATQRTVRFIRWLRNWIYRERPWAAARARLAIIWGCQT